MIEPPVAREPESPPVADAVPTSSAVRRTLALLAHTALAGLCLASGATLLGRVHVFELATHFRPHYTVAAAVCTITLALLRSKWATAIALLCMVFNGVPVLSYLLGSPTPPPPVSRGLRLMSININYGNRCHSCVLDAIQDANPDVLVLLEVTPALWRKLEQLDASYPYRAGRPGYGGGIGILSRYPLVEPRVLDLDDSGQPAMETRVDVGGSSLWVLALHPPPPTNRVWAWYRDRQLADAARRAHDAGGARVVTGDLNVTPWSPYYAKLIADSGLHDARRGFGIWPTWPTSLPPAIGLPIDHLFVSGLGVRDFRTGLATGSDHRPIVVDLSISAPE